MLGIIVATIFIAIFVNLLLKKFQLPTIIGYIFTGTIIAYLFGLHETAVNNHDLKEIAEFGVVFLMFTIGLEFSVNALIRMKREVFFTGTLQIIVTTLIVVLISFYILNFDFQTSMIIGTALSLSSTAIVLKTYNETRDIKKRHGQRVLGILIMQDIAVIPILLMISIFTTNSENSVLYIVLQTTIAAVILIGILYLSGKYLLEPFLTHVSETNSEELFVGSVLLIAIGASYMAHYFGFSYSLGAFIAGMMISETKFKHQVESDLIPFRNLLLGVFFVTVGMQINFEIIYLHLFTILLLLPILMVLKYCIIYLIVRLDDTKRVAFKTAFSLIQIGEFSLAILELARSANLLNATHTQILIVTIVLSMILTPLALKNLSKIASSLLPDDIMDTTNTLAVDKDLKGHVVVLGYGHLGQEIVRELKELNNDYIIIENKILFYKMGKDDNEPIIFGNAAHKHILESVNIRSSCAIIVAIDNPAQLRIVCESINELTKNTKTIVKITKTEDMKNLEGLHLEHIIVDDQVVAKALVDETRVCSIDFSHK
ncbi:cation:proton antiporter [Arcobacter sp.]|uniref:cation:proton antiporter n=1 Tax=unclassified Arcobacter TaxID=2593671 RepID=UPI003B00B09C|eukprot:TRINITY_DN1999_c0_g1_i1.p1 TRINITY_DN1999_c0_g1~~TRINITY_DN1999_c0_g1_i1.p1  ORF type:complete len:543 (-),score=-99.50 TRINITY_DN1999_c0_g1_i1:112-1740(-)